MAKKNGTKKTAVKTVAAVRKVAGATTVKKAAAVMAVEPKAAAPVRDPRLPKAGSTVSREFKGKKHTVTVLADGFRYAGKTFSSLSTIANTIAGGSWNGFLFFGLGKKATK